MNPDVWDIAVKSWYDLANSGGQVDAVVSWTKGEKFMNSRGAVVAFDDGAGTEGLQGVLSTPPPSYPGPFVEMDFHLKRPPGQNTIVELRAVTGESRTLDDPFGGHWRTAGTSWIFQVWSTDSEVIDLWLINDWAETHLRGVTRMWSIGDLEG